MCYVVKRRPALAALVTLRNMTRGRSLFASLPERSILMTLHTNAGKRRAEENSVTDHGHQTRTTEFYTTPAVKA